MYLNLFYPRSLMQRLSLLGKKVEAMLKSAWTKKDQIDNLLKERRLMRSLEKFVGGRLYEGDLRLRQKNHMILSYDVLIIQDCDGIPKRPAMFLNLWRYKVVRHRYSNPMIQPEPEGSTQGYPLVSVEVLRDYTHFYRLSHSELVDIEKNIRVILSTMKMEILLEPTSNKLMVEHAEFDESNANVLERFYTSAGNLVKEILLKLNLPDHRILKDGGEGT
ncbi:hypothetical protein Tco_0235710 [Tanacetum coccineum]